MTDKKVVDATPTKEFFINMLVKDIPLIRAIIDLVDNSIDGARRLRESDSFQGLKIEISLDAEQFKITDNCGGMPVNIAEDYAFRFGRPKDVEPTPNSVGLFGVGMKRAIFKMGNYFRMESNTQTSSFTIEEDIIEWARDDTNWKFEFKELSEDQNNESTGTTISVTKLHNSISKTFSEPNFVNDLEKQLQEAQQSHLENGLSIELNGRKIEPETVKLLFSNEITPAHFARTINTDDGEINIQIFAGLAERSPSDAGWYIFCNQRLILHASKEKVTGWGVQNNIPQYHNNFAAFRGFVYFEAENAKLLPWTTTKTEIDTDSPIFKAVLLDMMMVMEPVIDFLRDLVKEKRRIGDNGELQIAVKEAKSTAIINLSKTSQVFSAPSLVITANNPDYVNISFRMLKSKAQEVMDQIDATSYSKAGELAFEYYYMMECED